MEDGEYQIVQFSPNYEMEISSPKVDVYGGIDEYDLGTEIHKVKHKIRY